jgi:diaminopimelate epimerase
MRIDFTKMHALGNDFIVFDAPRAGRLPDPAELRRLADRRTGIGFDQALVLDAPHQAGSQVFYRVFNADGSEVEQCGNGARCIAALLRRLGRASPGEISMESVAGLVRARVEAAGTIAVNMGVPRFEPRALPFDAPAEAPTYPLDVDGTRVEIGAVSVGNPHAVLIVPSVDAAPVAALGAAIERHPRFPNRVNVGFMEILGRDAIKLRVYERGVGDRGERACARRGLACTLRGGQRTDLALGAGRSIFRRPFRHLRTEGTHSQ